MTKIFIPPKRLEELDLVLQYDTRFFKCELKEEKFFTWNERLLICRERARLCAKDHSYRQTAVLESKITAVLFEINKHKWKPDEKVQYAKNV